MTLPVGTISMSEVNVELGLSSTAQISLNDSAVRTLAGVPSGAISMQNLQGKANQFAFTISSNQTNANLRTLATTAGWNGTTKVVATIASGVYISSNSTGTPALTVSGSFPGGVELINNGYIVGMGGNGGAGGARSAPTAGSAGSAGGLALSVSSAISINNAGTIGGGGGGGGGGGARYTSSSDPTGDCCFNSYAAGGGGGGGRSGTTNSSGASGGSGASSGSAGTTASGGAGGSGGSDYGYSPYGYAVGGTGGTGGTWGSTGETGASGSGGGSRVVSSATYGGGAGGSAGGAVTGNSNITWVATGTRLGSIA